MESLHSDIIYRILSHVPASSILSCKLVCKTWKNLLCACKVGFLFMISLHAETNARLYYGDYDEVLKLNDNGEFSHEALTMINLPPMKMAKEPPRIVGSCNGLVCVSMPEDDDYCLYDPVYICNPTTGQYVDLPKLPPDDVGQIRSGFGYLPITNEYKVVRVYYSDKLQSTYPYINACGKVQVYTLGSGGGWRNIKDIPYQFTNIHGVVGNGVIYFMEYFNSKWKLVTFDLADEEFRVPEQPPCLDSASEGSFYEVKVLGGYLYVVHEEEESLDLWSFKNNHEKITNEDGSSEKDTDHPRSWRKEFSIPWQGVNDDYFREPIALTKSNQVLYLRHWLARDLCCYDPTTRTVNEIASVDPGIISSLQAIPHMIGNVSTRDIGKQSNHMVV